MDMFENIGTALVSKIMHTQVICIMPTYTIKTTIDTFRIHKISCAPVTSEDGKIVGIISEHDLLLQAASKSMSSYVDYNSKVTAISPETTIKEALVLFFTKKLKHAPVLDKNKCVIGIVSRIDLLNYLASNDS
jgi:CBS domain-containing protein